MDYDLEKFKSKYFVLPCSCCLRAGTRDTLWNDEGKYFDLYLSSVCSTMEEERFMVYSSDGCTTCLSVCLSIYIYSGNVEMLLSYSLVTIQTCEGI
ncbi:hypothetical protein I7I48_07327 [Histoplasma ohiense]|nr:hypothetical protein I7I48_07327 [Histoplasma ohiense (nom. inval.)]